MNPTPRWYPLRRHAGQLAYYNSPARFNVVPAGRRSGKTERAKRKIVREALKETRWPDAVFLAGAPTQLQAKRIFWKDLKALVPPWAVLGDILESELTIPLVNGSRIMVVGLDAPARVEGISLSGAVLDEYANMRAEVFFENIRPALSDRRGWCDFIGVPEGRNHYHDLYLRALGDTTGEWAVFTWKSADILPPDEIEAARNLLDARTFAQEYEASFVTFTGRAYYSFETSLHAIKGIPYDPEASLIVALDFNASPGVAAIIQEVPRSSLFFLASNPLLQTTVSAVIGEVFIPQHSNTPAVCRAICERWGGHRGPVKVYGDATGGARKSSQTEGTDWDLVRNYLRPVFRDRLSFDVPSSNPLERSRVNAMNSRLKSASEFVGLIVDPSKAPNSLRDFEGVRVLEGGSGEIDKDFDPRLTHLTDAIGYYVSRKFPVSGGSRLVAESV